MCSPLADHWEHGLPLTTTDSWPPFILIILIIHLHNWQCTNFLYIMLEWYTNHVSFPLFPTIYCFTLFSVIFSCAVQSLNWLLVCFVGTISVISDPEVVFGILFSSTLTQLQGLEPLKPNEQSDDLVVRNVSTMPPPKKLIQPSSNGMPPPPPRSMPPPPPPPKFHAPPEVKVQDKSKSLPKTKSDAVPG